MAARPRDLWMARSSRPSSALLPENLCCDRIFHSIWSLPVFLVEFSSFSEGNGKGLSHWFCQRPLWIFKRFSVIFWNFINLHIFQSELNLRVIFIELKLNDLVEQVCLEFCKLDPKQEMYFILRFLAIRTIAITDGRSTKSFPVGWMFMTDHNYP